MSAITLVPPCAGERHDLLRATDRELVTGLLRCGCFVDGVAAARVLKARRLVNSPSSGASRADRSTNAPVPPEAQ
jgi:hypothetical protein